MTTTEDLIANETTVFQHISITTINQLVVRRIRVILPNVVRLHLFTRMQRLMFGLTNTNSQNRNRSSVITKHNQNQNFIEMNATHENHVCKTAMK